MPQSEATITPSTDSSRTIGADSFFCVQEPWRVEFERGDDGSVETIALHFLRRSVKGVKSEN